jgi:hypothetical protein
MAHFAKLGAGDIVTQVTCVSNDIVVTEQAGIDFLNGLFKTEDVWKQTSYNTQDGVHKLDGTPFRKNHAGIGYTYDAAKDAFIPPQPYPSWTLNEDTCQWDAPTAYPDDGKRYEWNEGTTSWDEVSE